MRTYPTTFRLTAPLVGMVLSFAAANADEAPRGASACSGCHQASQSAGITIPQLHGRPQQAIIAALQGFKSGRLPATVMDRIAKGFTDEEIEAIGRWFEAQN